MVNVAGSRFSRTVNCGFMEDIRSVLKGHGHGLHMLVQVIET